MLGKFSFQGMAKEAQKEKRKTLDVIQLVPLDAKKPIGLSEEVVEYMIALGNFGFIRLFRRSNNASIQNLQFFYN
jgi:hypothetical protein